MRKLICALVVNVSVVCFLSGCEAHFGDKTFFIPWWLIVILAVLCFVIASFAISKRVYVCPKCHKRFKPKWWNGMFSAHMGSDRVLRCPHCKAKELCSLSYEQD